MRFYPFGSSSLNQVYNITSAITSSISDYAITASYGFRIVTASHALSGVPGINGAEGSCSFVAGPTGDTGPVGFGGSVGGQSIAQSGSV
jgi:hypothetical protein